MTEFEQSLGTYHVLKKVADSADKAARAAETVRQQTRDLQNEVRRAVIAKAPSGAGLAVARLLPWEALACTESSGEWYGIAGSIVQTSLMELPELARVLGHHVAIRCNGLVVGVAPNESAATVIARYQLMGGSGALLPNS